MTPKVLIVPELSQVSAGTQGMIPGAREGSAWGSWKLDTTGAASAKDSPRSKSKDDRGTLCEEWILPMVKYFEPTGAVAEKGGPMVRYHTSSFDGSAQPYAIYVPGSYAPERRWPLILSLHGLSSDHVLNLRRVFGMGNKPDEDGEECKKHFPPFPEIPFIVASPYAFGSVGYGAIGEVEVLDVLEDVKRHYSIDENRVYLTGLSMGGEGVWHLGLRYPHLWAAIAPVCAPISRFIGPEDVRRLAGNAMHVPAHVSHGAEDPVVPVGCSRQMVSLLRECKSSVEYVEYPGVGHHAWNYTYAGGRIFDWFAGSQRIEKPASISYTTDCLRYSKAYWLRITRIADWGREAWVDADVTGDNTIDVRVENVSAFALNLPACPVKQSHPITVIRCNGEELLAASTQDESAEIELASPPAGKLLKRSGLEGPVYDVYRSGFAVVYGTQGRDSRAIEAVRRAAECAADWGEWADIDIPLLADKDVSDKHIRLMNLVLVGDDRTNALIAKINDSLPIRFTDDGVQVGIRSYAADLGIIQVYPNPLNRKRYVLVLGCRQPDMLIRAVQCHGGMPDYAVFNPITDFGRPHTFIACGHFDGAWRLRDG